MIWIIFTLIFIICLGFTLKPQLTVKNFNAIPSRFVVIDIETTGLNPETDEIIEVAAIRVNRDESNHSFVQGLVKIQGKVPQKITEITGITVDMLNKDGDSLEATISELLNLGLT